MVHLMLKESCFAKLNAHQNYLLYCTFTIEVNLIYTILTVP